MKIRRAQEKDMPRIDELLTQVNLVHHRGRPDLFRYGTRKYTDEELRAGNYDVDYMTEDGTFAPAVSRVLQDETNQLWRDMRVMHGKAPNQIKPVHIIDTEQKRRFFFALIDGEIEG